MDKEFTKKLLTASGIDQGDHVVLRDAAGALSTDPGVLDGAARERLGLPVFVKPSRAGSSIGITRVTDWAQFPEAVATAAAVDRKVVVEAAVRGGVIELEREHAAAAVDDILGFHDMAVHRRELVLARDHDLLGITHAAAAPEILLRTVADGEQEEAHLVEAPLAVVGDVPAEASADDAADQRALVDHLLRRPVCKGR